MNRYISPVINVNLTNLHHINLSLEIHISELIFFSEQEQNCDVTYYLLN